MLKGPPHLGQHRAFQIVGRGQRGMAALTRQGDPAAAGAQHRANPQAGARAHHGQHAAVGWRVRVDAVAEPMTAQPGIAQARQGQRQRLEIVEHQQAVQAQCGLHSGPRERPMAVGEGYAVTGHRRGHRKRGVAGRPVGRAQLGLQCGQVGVRGFGRAGMLGDRQFAHLRHGLARPVQASKARIGAADIGDQVGIEGRVRADRHGRDWHRLACPVRRLDGRLDGRMDGRVERGLGRSTRPLRYQAPCARSQASLPA